MRRSDAARVPAVHELEVRVPAGGVEIVGNLNLPEEAAGVVLFAHGSGSSRHSPRNRFVAEGLNRTGLATLLIDLLSHDEEQIDIATRQHRFDIDLLSERLRAAVDWLAAEPRTKDLAVGLFGASTGAAAALRAAAEQPHKVSAVVSRGGRPDLAGEGLPLVRAPTLLIVGGEDQQVIVLNERAREQMVSAVRLEIVPGATHLFEEPGKLERVVALARDWFGEHLRLN